MRSQRGTTSHIARRAMPAFWNSEKHHAAIRNEADSLLL